MHQQLIIEKISSILAATEHDYDRQLVGLVDEANGIFLAGAGRSALVCKNFAMRLMHSGYKVNIVGETVTPSIQEGDLLIVISGSGETQQLAAFTQKAKDVGAKAILISSKSESTIGNMVDAVFNIGRPDMYEKVFGMPMGSVFELSTLIFLEAVVSYIIHERNLTEEEMRAVHANME
ncbi:MAG TPA: 6-phospho-3-hexuloisomerase [Methylococcaceae bacterium]|jgi:6-phospho-3-hexuloisomerase/3-hexulose-6-phosphate synthase/6-phospho-3-hexuloisomerase|nr:6-phospho-3-hexuloisomerase [Methylococcaceae bacterium]